MFSFFSFRSCLRLLTLLVLSVSFMRGLAADGKLTVTALNIPDVNRGAGLALVLQTPSGKTWLYDTGAGYPAEKGWEGDYNCGRDQIAPFLKERGIAALDGVMISHAHYDHFGGLIWLKDNLPIGRLIDSGYEFPGSENQYLAELKHYSRVRAQFAEQGKHLAAFAGDRLKLDDQLEVEVIAPPKTYFADVKAETRAANDSPAHYLVNANSLGVLLRHGDVVFYMPGDIQTEDIEKSLLPSLPPGKIKCHVLFAPGHGIHGTPAFAEATRPEVSIASVFPRYARGLKSTPQLKAVGAKTYITGIHGWVRVVSDGKSYTVTAEHPDAK